MEYKSKVYGILDATMDNCIAQKLKDYEAVANSFSAFFDQEDLKIQLLNKANISYIDKI